MLKGIKALKVGTIKIIMNTGFSLVLIRVVTYIGGAQVNIEGAHVKWVLKNPQINKSLHPSVAVLLASCRPTCDVGNLTRSADGAGRRRRQPVTDADSDGLPGLINARSDPPET